MHDDFAFMVYLAIAAWIGAVLFCAFEVIWSAWRKRGPRSRLFIFFALICGAGACETPTAPPPEPVDVVGEWRGEYGADGILTLSVRPDLTASLLDRCADPDTGLLCPQVRGKYETAVSLSRGNSVLVPTPDGDLITEVRDGRMEGTWRGIHITLAMER